MSYSLIGPTTPELTASQILDLSRLKMRHWDYPLDSQIAWLRDHADPKDRHMLAYQDGALIAYARMIVGRPAVIDGQAALIGGLSTIIVAPEQRGSGLGASFVRRCTGLLDGRGLLQCSNGMRHFYERTGWTIFGGQVSYLAEGQERPFRTDDLIMIHGAAARSVIVEGEPF